MKLIDQQIQWLQQKQNQGITYSMVSRNGPDSYDCSSAGYYSLIAGGFFPSDIRIGNTDSAFGDLERNGFTQLQPNAQGNYDTQRGDVAIWGKRGASSGSFGHFMTFTDTDNVIHCSSGYNGIHTNNYDQLRRWNGYPEQTFYSYIGGASSPAVLAGDPNDQNVDVGSFIKFPNPLMVNGVQLVRGAWQARIDALCPAGFTWDDNGVPTDSLVEVDAEAYATVDQDLVAGSSIVLPGKYQVLDLVLIGSVWFALIKSNGLNFWIDLAQATEVPESDGGTQMPGAHPEAPASAVPIPANPVVTTPDPPAAPESTPIPESPIIPSLPAKETNQVKENTMSFTQDQQQELKVATQSAQDIADSVAADQTVREIISEIPQKVKIGIYIIGDALIGLGLISPSVAVVVGWTDVVRIVALSSVLATAGAFILTMFGIYQSKK